MWIKEDRPQQWLSRALPRLVFSLLAILAIFVSLLALSSVLFAKAGLNIAPDGTFQIAVFSDLHYGENESTFGPPQDINSAALMRQVLAQEQPDFVVLNGDLITGENTFAFNSTGYVDEIVAPLVQGGYRWASTYGNHDSKYNLSREALYAEEKKYANAYTKHGPAGTDGVSNYVLEVHSPVTTGSSPRPIVFLWFFDSRGGSVYQSLPANMDNIDNYVSNGTVAWYRLVQVQLQVGLHTCFACGSFHPDCLCVCFLAYLCDCNFSLTAFTPEKIRHRSLACLCTHTYARICRSSRPDLPQCVWSQLSWPQCGLSPRSTRLLGYRLRSHSLHASATRYSWAAFSLLRSRSRR